MATASTPAHNPLICAIDTADLDTAVQWVQAIHSHVGLIKLGLEFFTAHGPEGIRRVTQDAQIPFFLDLKLHDIPNTVAKAVRSVLSLKPAMLTIHTSGGLEMMQAAIDAANDTDGTPPLILGVTVLTSMDKANLQQTGVESEVDTHVLRLVELAHSAGVKGCVCSPQEVALIRKRYDHDALTLVTPGIRPAAADDDQKRVMTPQEAIKAGSDYIVVGRPITQAENPAEAARQIAESITR